MYFTIPEFVIPILAFKDDPASPQDVEMQSAEQQQSEDALTKKLAESGRNLIKELQKLFTAMAVSNKKYLDPSGVLKAIVNSQGEQMTIGEEKDIREFNDVLLSRIKDAFEHKVKQEEERKAQAENQESKPEMTQVPEESARPAALATQSSFMDAGDQPESQHEEAKEEAVVIAPLVRKVSVVEKQLQAIDSTFIGKANTQI